MKIFRFNGELLGKHKWAIAVSCLLRAICMGCCALSISMLTKEVINEVSGGNALHWHSQSAMWLYVTLVLFVGYGISDYALRRNTVFSGKTLRETIIDGSLNQPYSTAENRLPQFMMALNQDVPQYLGMIEQNIPELISTCITTGIMLIAAFRMNVLVSILSLVCSGIFGISVVLIKKIQQMEESAHEQNEGITEILLEIHKGLPLFHLFTGTARYLGKYITAIRQLYSIDKKKAKISASLSLLAYSSNIVREFGVIFLAYVLSSADLGTTGALLNITSFVNGFAVTVILGVSQMSRGIVAARHIAVQTQTPHEMPVETIPPTKIESFACRNLSYHYENGTGFSDVSLEVKAGQIAGIVGNIGAGKTTLAKLLCGLIEPATGAVLVNDTQIENITYLRQCTAVVDQACTIFPGSVLDNITMFSNQDNSPVTDLIAQVGLSTWVNYLPQGLATVLDPDALSMSGGQRQRLVLARAIFRKANILLFDEPTASLDNQGVRDFVDMVLSLKTDRIILIVTHDSRLMSSFEITYHLDHV